MILYVVLGALAVQRIAELVLARRNAAWLRAQGAVFERADGFGLILTVHVLLFALPVVESVVWGIQHGWWTVAAVGVFAAGQGLRYHAILHLGRRWNTRVYTLPGPLVATGLYGRIRHPNYLGVALEIAALPAAFGLWRTALLLSALNAVALARRIRVEDRLLAPARA